MAAACSVSWSPHRSTCEQRRAAEARHAWQAPARSWPGPHGLNTAAAPDSTLPALSRQLTIRTRAAASAAASAQHNSAADLAVYHFAQRRAGTAAEWFQAAVRDIVRQADSQAPFLQTVQLPANGGPPRLASYGVHESVVAAPELWQGIAEHVSHSDPDVVILVQRVSPHAAAGSPQGAMDAAEAEQQRQQQAPPPAAASSSSSSSAPGSPRSPRVQAEEACRRLMSSGLADSILLGKVGDCCDGSGHAHEHEHGEGGSSSGAGPAAAAGVAEPRGQQAPPSRPLPLPAIVPFGSPASSGSALQRRKAVRAAALRPPGAPGPSAGACQQSACYYGVVVQSRRHTGVEGCYLLKTVKSVSRGTGCSCTHFSLTRISAGEHLEKQFVQSWLL